MKKLIAASTVAVLSAASLAQAADKYPFIGTWDCEVSTFTFTAKSYNNGAEDLAIKKVAKGKDGSYTLSFADDYQIVLSGFKGNSMGWFSPASGDSFNCKRV